MDDEGIELLDLDDEPEERDVLCTESMMVVESGWAVIEEDRPLAVVSLGSDDLYTAGREDDRKRQNLYVMVHELLITLGKYLKTKDYTGVAVSFYPNVIVVFPAMLHTTLSQAMVGHSRMPDSRVIPLSGNEDA